MISSEAVSRLYLETESVKKQRGVEGTARKSPLFFKLVSSWQPGFIHLSQIEALEMWISLEGRHGTFQIYKELHSTNIGSVSENVERLRSLGKPTITSWLNPVSRELGDLVCNCEVKPAILVYPPCLLQGNVFDGNHRLLSALIYADEQENITLPCVVGKIGWVSWCLIFLRSMVIQGNIPVADKLDLARNRLHNFHKIL